MNLCKIGLHNCEVLEKLGRIQLEELIESELESRWCRDIIIEEYRFYVKKVCLKCGKIIDTITPQVNRLKQRYYDERNRQELAQKIVGG